MESTLGQESKKRKLEVDGEKEEKEEDNIVKRARMEPHVLECTKQWEHSTVYAEDASSTEACLLTIKGAAPHGQHDRPNLHLSIVLDTSGSMCDVLPMVRKVLSFIMTYLRAGDHLSIFTFSDTASVLVAPVAVSDDAKNAIETKLAALIAVGGTNIESGLTLADRTFADRAAEAKRDGLYSVMLLFTDGQPDTGATTAEGLRKALKHTADYDLIALGFGKNHNGTMLMHLGNRYAHIPDEEAIPSVMGEQFGGFVSTVARNVVVTLTARDPHRFHNVKTTFPATTASSSCTVKLGTIWTGRTCPLVAKFQVGKDDGDIFTMAISYTDNEGMERQMEELVALARSDVIPTGAGSLPNPEVAVQEHIITISNALVSFQAAIATEEDEETARARLEAATDAALASDVKDDPRLRRVVSNADRASRQGGNVAANITASMRDQTLDATEMQLSMSSSASSFARAQQATPKGAIDLGAAICMGSINDFF